MYLRDFPLVLNDIIREDMQGLIYVRVWYIMYHFNIMIIIIHNNNINNIYFLF